MKKFIILSLIILLLLAGAFVYYLWSCEDDWCFLFDWQKIRATNDFGTCAVRGFPVTESFPRNCRAGQKSFTEILNTQPAEVKSRIISPQPNQVVTSPLAVEGEVRGNWYFEATFPVKLVDENGKIIAQTAAQAQGDWMTEKFVPFKAELVFSKSQTAKGILVLEKDNPSGLPQHDDKIEIPVRFFP